MPPGFCMASEFKLQAIEEHIERLTLEVNRQQEGAKKGRAKLPRQ